MFRRGLDAFEGTIEQIEGGKGGRRAEHESGLEGGQRGSGPFLAWHSVDCLGLMSNNMLPTRAIFPSLPAPQPRDESVSEFDTSGTLNTAT